MELTKILQKVLEIGGSDLFLIPGSPVTAKVKGHLVPLTESKLLPEDTAGMIQEAYGMAGGHSDEMLRRDGDDDFSFSFNRQARFRCNAYKQRGTLAATCRVVTFGLPNPDALHIPPMVIDLASSCRNGMVLVTGPAGSGKSTITKLLLRYHDVTEGRITLHGQDIRELTQKDVRSAVSYVPQKAWLFSGTIAENLRYGDPDATEERLRHALHIAQSDFVLELPDGLNAPVAQGGTNFSGGQKQRLSIARALAKKADLYVFDDSFSALDFKTDAALRHALKEEMKDAAVLIIAQRISTILHADQILVLNDGRIVGKGRHKELLQTCEIYRDIVNSQMKGGVSNG